MFLQRVTELIDSHGITRNKLLTDIGLNKNSFVAWTNRGTVPGGDTLSKIADYFHVSTDYLLGRTDEKSEKEPTANGGGLNEVELAVALAYRVADDRAKQIVDLTLEPWKKSSAPDAAM